MSLVCGHKGILRIGILGEYCCAAVELSVLFKGAIMTVPFSVRRTFEPCIRSQGEVENRNIRRILLCCCGVERFV